MEPLTYIDRGKRKAMKVDEFMALDLPSDSDDGLDFDDFSDEDPTVNLKDLESSDTDSELETSVINVKKSSGIIENQLHPSIGEVGQPTTSNVSQPTSNVSQPKTSNVSQPTASNINQPTSWGGETNKQILENVRFCGKNKILIFLVNHSYSQDTMHYHNQYYNYLHHTSFQVFFY
jgi:hypothetical protein